MPHWVWPTEAPAENERAVFDFDLVVPDGATAIEILAYADNRMVL